MADGGSAPSTPDPYAVSDAQTKANSEAARLNTQLNRADQVTPWGTLSWNQAPGTREFDTRGYNEALTAWNQAKISGQVANNPTGGGTGFPVNTGGVGGGGGPTSGGPGSNGVDGGTTSAGTGGGTAGGGVDGGAAGASASAGARLAPGAGAVATDASGVAADGGTATHDPAGRPRKQDYWDDVPSDEWTSTIKLNPEMQKLFDAQNGSALVKQDLLEKLQGQATDTLGRPLNYTKLPDGGNAAKELRGVPGMPEADEAYRQKVEDALYGRFTSRLDPKFEQEENSMRSELMNRGLVEGSEAWKTQMDAFNRSKNDAYAAAGQNAVAGGGAEMQRYFGMGMQANSQGMTNAINSFNLREGDRRTSEDEWTRKRNNILNEMNGLASGGQMQMPGFGGTPSGTNVQPTNVGGNIWQAFQGQMGGYNADVASANSTNAAGAAALSTIAAAFI